MVYVDLLSIRFDLKRYLVVMFVAENIFMVYVDLLSIRFEPERYLLIILVVDTSLTFLWCQIDWYSIVSCDVVQYFD